MSDGTTAQHSEEGEVELLRELGLHERYALSRYNVGFPVIVALSASVDQTLEALHSHLLKRIALLLERVPLLSTHVSGARTRTPRFAKRLAPASASAYLSIGASTSLSNAELLAEEIGLASERHVEGPLWHVTLLPSSQPEVTHVVLATNHVLVDGRGTANLFESLLSPTPLDQGRPFSLGLPERSDKILPMAPPLGYLLKVVFNELLLPRLPGFISQRMLPKSSWPTDKPLPYTPYTRERRVQGISFPASATKALKQVATQQGLKTIQPLLQLAAAIAAYTVAAREEVLLGSGTPINVRVPERDSFCSGNFVSLHEWQCDVKADSSIWSIAADYAEDISSPTGRRSALHVMGMLAHIPDAPTHTPTPEAPTGWEVFFNAKKTSARPYRSSFGISNLGLVRLEGVGAREVCWAQTPSPYGEALMIDACCLALEKNAEAKEEERKGIAISVGWRDGCVPGEEFVSAFKAALLLLIAEAEGEKRLAKDTTMSQVATLVREKMKT